MHPEHITALLDGCIWVKLGIWLEEQQVPAVRL